MILHLVRFPYETIGSCGWEVRFPYENIGSCGLEVRFPYENIGSCASESRELRYGAFQHEEGVIICCGGASERLYLYA